MQLTLAAVAAATGGELRGDPTLLIETVTVDSRDAKAGSLFVALTAARDGHEFTADAARRGAVAALVERPVGAPAAQVVVDQTVAALGALGRHARGMLGDGTAVIGITGSSGKTSTKDLTEAAFAASLPTVASAASFNNEIGLPLTLLRAGDSTEVVVVEMGARGVGHIAYLCDIARPTAAAITNIGLAHAELFGTVEATALAKGELLEALPASGIAVLNADDAMTPGLRARTRAPVLLAGHAPGADVRITALTLDATLHPTVSFATPWGDGEVTLSVRGAHQGANAAIALALAGAHGVPLDRALAGMAGATGSAWRMELNRSRRGVVVLNDAYNANPDSVRSALDALAATQTEGRRIAVLGVMAELGVRSEVEHRRVGEHAAGLAIDQIVVVGQEAAPIADGIRAVSANAAGDRASCVADAAAALAAVRELVEPGDVVLVKASRVARLERLAWALAEDAEELTA